MGSIERNFKRKRDSAVELQRKQLNEMNRIVGMAMHEQLLQIGVDPASVDPDNDIAESSVTGGDRRVTHYHYKGQLLVEVIRIKLKKGKGFNYQVNVPRRATDGEVIKTDAGHVSVN